MVQWVGHRLFSGWGIDGPVGWGIDDPVGVT